MSQRSRRHNPWTWEIPTCVVAAITLVMVCEVASREVVGGFLVDVRGVVT
jgi:hypothetical protein